MKALSLKKSLLILLAVLLCALSLASCKTTLKPGDKGLYDKQKDITYSHASTVYEATALVKEYGKLAVTSKESYTLYSKVSLISLDTLSHCSLSRPHPIIGIAIFLMLLDLQISFIILSACFIDLYVGF